MKNKIKSNGHGPKRAGIYVRVSSEEQAFSRKDGAEKASPQAQEREVREKLESMGYRVVGVYRDIERYRTKTGKLVEPSGTRSDRPGYLQMLKDIDVGKLDVIGSWRVDRLYRGINLAFIELQDRVEQGKVGVISVKDHYEPTTAGFLAAAARVELQAKHDRLMMGVAKRLHDGKMWNSRPPLGYGRQDGNFVIDPHEANTVALIWNAYAEGIPVRAIRDRLIGTHTPQRMTGRITHVHPWKLSYIRDILHHDYYYTGLFTWAWDGAEYEVKIPPIITDPAIAAKVKARFASYKAYPAGNLQNAGLASGLVYCSACNYKMRTAATSSRNEYGKIYTYTYYICQGPGQDIHNEGCAAYVRISKVDAELWGKVWGLIENKQRFQSALDKRITQLQEQEKDVTQEVKRLEVGLSDLELEEARLATLFRKGILDEKILATQAEIVRAQRADLEQELAEKQLLVGNQSGRLKELAEIYRQDVLEGQEAIIATPQTPEQARLQFEARRKIVQRLVTRVEVKADKSIDVHTEIDLSATLKAGLGDSLLVTSVSAL